MLFITISSLNYLNNQLEFKKISILFRFEFKIINILLIKLKYSNVK